MQMALPNLNPSFSNSIDPEETPPLNPLPYRGGRLSWEQVGDVVVFFCLKHQLAQNMMRYEVHSLETPLLTPLSTAL